MKKIWVPAMLLALLLGRGGSASSMTETPRRSVSMPGGEGGILRVGILPVQDETGEAFGETLSENLTRLIFYDLAKLGMQSVFLNPGGTFDPSDNEWISEIAKQERTDAVLLTRLTAITNRGRWDSFRKALKDSNAKERLSGDSSTLGREALYKVDVDGLLRNKRGLLICETSIARAGNIVSRETFYTSADIKLSFLQELAASEGILDLSRSKFKDTPLGRAAFKSSEQISRVAREVFSAFNVSGTGKVVPTGNGCAVTVRVRYSSKNRASKNYTIAVNGKEESVGIQDGIVTVKVPSGLLHVRVVVQDAPYKLPVQKNYDANTYFECLQAEKNLVLEIGGAGEASLVWK
jgi:hypothetical protein